MSDKGIERDLRVALESNARLRAAHAEDDAEVARLTAELDFYRARTEGLEQLQSLANVKCESSTAERDRYRMMYEEESEVRADLTARLTAELDEVNGFVFGTCPKGVHAAFAFDAEDAVECPGCFVDRHKAVVLAAERFTSNNYPWIRLGAWGYSDAKSLTAALAALRPEQETTFYEEDEDPAKIHAAFEAGEKGITAPPSVGHVVGESQNVGNPLHPEQESK